MNNYNVTSNCERECLKIFMDVAISSQATWKQAEGSTHSLHGLNSNITSSDMLLFVDRNERKTMENHERVLLKICTSCEVEKPATDYSRNKSSRDGRLTKCKACIKTARQALSETNPDAYARQLAQSQAAKKRLGKAHLKASKSAWDYKNTDHVKAYAKAKYDADPEFHREVARNYRFNNPAKVLAAVNKWKANNPERHKILKRKADVKRNLAARNARVAWANQDKIDNLYADARMRTIWTGIEYQVDHIVPYVSDVVCGLHCEDNLQIITASENFRKSNAFK